jgi:signal peptidase II
VKRNLWLLMTIAAVIVVVDFVSKQWVMAHLPYERPVDLLGPYLRLTYTRNSGVAFGLGQGTNFPYYIFSIIAAVAIVAMFLRSRVPSVGRQIALALILGGALGNLVDRVRFGEVVDFIQVGTDRWYWPVFNVADSAVTVGVLLFALAWPRHETRQPSLEPASLDVRSTEHAESEPTNAESVGAGPERGGATGPLSGDGTSGPLA